MPAKKLPTLNAAARDVLNALDSEQRLSFDVRSAANVLRAVLDRDSKRRSKRLTGVAGRKPSTDYTAMDALLKQGLTGVEIAATLGVSEFAVSRRKRQIEAR